ncbi:MAG TPA: response regulator transcription factor [Patescibacteria group bacterium]|nr:response regulator transcription factor [Patescibacteria group bacterium]
MKILLIEDDKELCKITKNKLNHKGASVDVAHDGYQGLMLAKNNYYDCLVMDYMLPKINGDLICEELRNENYNYPIIGISVINELNKKLTLLKKGIDYYLTKPFSFAELWTMIENSTKDKTKAKSKIKIKDLIIDKDNFKIKCNNKIINVSVKEYELLLFLCINKDKTHTRQSIYENVWDANNNLLSNTVDVHITQLRHKLKKAKSKLEIQTIFKRGFKLLS